MSKLVCKDLTIGYEDKTLFAGFNCEINAGDYVFVVGSNGAGKTTLVRTLLGLRAPLSGSVEIDAELKAKGIGYLPQAKSIQKDFPASVKEVVMSGCKGDRKSRETQALDALKRLNVDDLYKRSFSELSGGQQQRVLLARALCAAGGLLLLDEPVASLDAETTEDFYNLIADLNENDGITIIMISHDNAAVAEYASHVLHICENPHYETIDSDLGHKGHRIGKQGVQGHKCGCDAHSGNTDEGGSN